MLEQHQRKSRTTTFPQYRKEMKGVGWGYLYNAHKDDDLDPATLEAETARLMADDDVTKKKGIYEYLLTKNEKHLNIRAFTDAQKRTLYERQKGICCSCKNHFEIANMEADHITPWSQGGKTEIANGQMLCRDCNRQKSDK
ncbi:HNH endonuclease [Chitinibacter sp. S2-10]|uniref:HNH endonuclease n=1 Tax=Chitinibacter sp. S2-10 TaxID=3373597 RepID=UPI003977B098